MKVKKCFKKMITSLPKVKEALRKSDVSVHLCPFLEIAASSPDSFLSAFEAEWPPRLMRSPGRLELAGPVGQVQRRLRLPGV